MWADRLIEGCRLAWSPDPDLRGFYEGTSACLSALCVGKKVVIRRGAYQVVKIGKDIVINDAAQICYALIRFSEWRRIWPMTSRG